jgi:poly(A) polymerase Pap1
MNSVNKSTFNSNNCEGPFVKYGVTNPISLKRFTEKDALLTKSLINVLKEKNLYETKEGEEERRCVLEQLSQLLNVKFSF